MKRIFISIILLTLILSNGISNAQTTHPVELGFNIGASWLQSDIKMKKLGGAGGFTLGQMYSQNDKNALDWGWRFRYLNATAYGQDSKKSMGIANNPILTGAYDNNLNYYSNGGFVYQNYRTSINELSLELVIGANRMRNKTKIYPYVFGGLGITKAVAKTDQLDGSDIRYNYISVDSNGTANGSQITSSLNNLYDGSYETFAEGSENARWKFMPSVGVGLGYQFTPVFSMGLEHKMTWALHDGLDGQQWTNENTLSSNKDKYHYSSVWLKFSFGRGAHHTTTITNNNTTNNIVTTSGDKPTVIITNPSVSSYTSTTQSYTVRATVKGVTSKSDIGLVYNGVSNANFTYDATSHQFAFPLMLLNGSNSFMITATNGNGSTTDNATVLYETQIIVPPPAPAPMITITSPSSNPFSTTMNNATVVATVLNVASQSQIGITINGVATGSFIFNPSSHGLTVSSNLNPGANTFVISATNASGSDSKSTTIIYAITNVTPPPFITIVNPAINPFTSSVSSLPINAIVQNVTSVGQISVTTNGAPMPSGMLAFNPSTGQLNFSSNLMAGANTITISATNVAGADSKSITIIYSQPVVTAPAPIITITSPAVNPFNTTVSLVSVDAIILNVTSPSQISATFNGAASSAFTYNMATKQFSFLVNLISGANVVTITASTPSGSDSKSQTLIYSQPVSLPAPIVTITSPTVNPFNTSSNATTITAIVLNVAAASQISVSLNGVSTSAFSYNVGTKQFSFAASLIAGANIVSVSASTASGSDSKSQTIIYSQPVASPAPVVTITSPSVNPFNTSTATATVNATVLNVTASSQITATINGGSISFTYNLASKQLALTASLIAGGNNVTISANTPSGSDSKSTTIIYSAPVAMPAPIVTFVNPTSMGIGTTTSVYNVEATVVNVLTASSIVVKVNGVNLTAFTYNASSKQVKFNASLVVGPNTVTITATNTSGTDTKSVIIKYRPTTIDPITPDTTANPANPGTPNVHTPPGSVTPKGGGTASTPAAMPTIVFGFPNPYTASTPVLNVTATVNGVAMQSDIVVKVNGVVIAFTYGIKTKIVSFSAPINMGMNSISIAATNPTGTKTESLSVLRH